MAIVDLICIAIGIIAFVWAVNVIGNLFCLVFTVIYAVLCIEQEARHDFIWDVMARIKK